MEDDGEQWDWLQVRLGVAPDSQGCFHPGPQVGTVDRMRGGRKSWIRGMEVGLTYIEVGWGYIGVG